MAERLVLQKLLSTRVAEAIVVRGVHEVGGLVTSAAAVAGLRSPGDLLAAHGVDVEQEFADVVRFATPPLAETARPSTAEERPWPTFPTGFLKGGSVAPVWDLSRTRYSLGAEYWRIRADGEQRCLSVYQGAARGWRGAREWAPPSPLVGPRARWRGHEVPADVDGDRVLLTLRAEAAPADAKEVRPGVWVAAVSLADCEVFETVVRATVHGIQVRVLASDGMSARVLVSSDDPDEAARLGGEMVEPGVFEAVVAVDELSDRRGVTRELSAPKA